MYCKDISWVLYNYEEDDDDDDNAAAADVILYWKKPSFYWAGVCLQRLYKLVRNIFLMV